MHELSEAQVGAMRFKDQAYSAVDQPDARRTELRIKREELQLSKMKPECRSSHEERHTLKAGRTFVLLGINALKDILSRRDQHNAKQDTYNRYYRELCYGDGYDHEPGDHVGQTATSSDNHKSGHTAPYSGHNHTTAAEPSTPRCGGGEPAASQGASGSNGTVRAGVSNGDDPDEGNCDDGDDDDDDSEHDHAGDGDGAAG